MYEAVEMIRSRQGWTGKGEKRKIPSVQGLRRLGDFGDFHMDMDKYTICVCVQMCAVPQWQSDCRFFWTHFDQNNGKITFLLFCRFFLIVLIFAVFFCRFCVIIRKFPVFFVYRFFLSLPFSILVICYKLPIIIQHTFFPRKYLHRYLQLRNKC